MDDLKIKRLIGSLFIMGFEGTTVTGYVRSLIEDHFVGSFLLTAKNMSSASQATQLIKDLQNIACGAEFEHPLLIAIDQENGIVNSVFDEAYIQQFPSAMGVVAGESLEMAHEVAFATAKEMSFMGVNWIMGPVLDVLSNIKTQPLGVRSMGDDPKEVTEFGLQFINGYHEGGLATCGKHFPSYGNLEFDGSILEVPIVTETIEKLRSSGLIPFRAGIRASLDAMLVGACSMRDFDGAKVEHACLSKAVVTGLLRQELGFNGVVMTDCFEIGPLYENLGIGQATIMSLSAGCDMFMGLRSGVLALRQLEEASERVIKMKKRWTSWDKALNPPGVQAMNLLQRKHKSISIKAYNASISLLRDKGQYLPLPDKRRHHSSPQQQLVLLTPLVQAFASAASQISKHDLELFTPMSPHLPKITKTLQEAEETFRNLGLAIGKRWPGRVLHTSYTASGIRPVHEDLISSASAVIVLTADAGRNMYQYGFTKYIASLCKETCSPNMPNGIPCIVVAVSSPYDFAHDRRIGTYICTYDFTEPALNSLVDVLFGDLLPTGVAPGTNSYESRELKIQKRRRNPQSWLVDEFDPVKDLEALQQLMDRVYYFTLSHSGDGDTDVPLYCTQASSFTILQNENFEAQHFVIRNSSTKVLYGFCATYMIPETSRASIGCVIVDPEKRRSSIGRSIHMHALNYLSRKKIATVQFGSDMPGLLAGIPVRISEQSLTLRSWLNDLGWPTEKVQTEVVQNYTRILKVPDLSQWSTSQDVHQRLQSIQAKFEVLKAHERPELMTHILAQCQNPKATSALNDVKVLQKLYDYVLKNHRGGSITLVRDITSNVILGCGILYSSKSPLASLLPTGSDDVGGITGLIVQLEKRAAIVQSLLTIAITQFKIKGFRSVELRIADNSFPFISLQDIGFELAAEYISVFSEVEKLSQNSSLS